MSELTPTPAELIEKALQADLDKFMPSASTYERALASTWFRAGARLTLETVTTELNAGSGWYEVIHRGQTCIAYVYEDGSIYFPEGDQVLDRQGFAFAAARGEAHRLVRADDAEVRALAAILAEAPHDGDVCNRIIRDQYGRPVERDGVCTCWKSKLPADALASRDAGQQERGWRDAVARLGEHEKGVAYADDIAEGMALGDYVKSRADRIEKEEDRG